VDRVWVSSLSRVDRDDGCDQPSTLTPGFVARAFAVPAASPCNRGAR
jgi:hypothetical protein